MPIQDSHEVGKSQKPLYIKIFLWEGCTQAFMEDKAKCSDLRGICGRFGAIIGAPTAMWVRYAHPGLRLGRNDQQTAIHKDIFMGGLHTNTKRLTKPNAVTLGVSLVIWGPLWEPQWPWVCNMLILD